MRKKYIMAFCLVAAFPANAQETYENANIVTGDLNGTARYVGMGGAMDALGAEISTISTNPAGLGLFRSSQISATGGFTMQQDAKDFNNASKAHADFDQIGFVWSGKNNGSGNINFSFNYHKSRDFNYILSAAQDLPKDFYASQNALSYIKAIGDPDKTGESTIAVNSPDKNHNYYYGDFYYTSQLDNLYYNTFIVDMDGAAGFNMADALYAYSFSVAEECQMVVPLCGGSSQGFYRYNREHPSSFYTVGIDADMERYSSRVPFSCVKRMDKAVAELVRQWRGGELPRVQSWGLASGYVDVVVSSRYAGRLDAVKASLHDEAIGKEAAYEK